MNPMMITKSKMIVVCGEENIFGSSIQNLLASKSEWIVVRVSTIEDFRSSILPDLSASSDIVIIHPVESPDFTTFALHLLQEKANIRVITISLENNAMNIYDKHTFLIKKASDLIAVIDKEAESQPASIRPSRR
jgi:predicted transcriptional regulator